MFKAQNKDFKCLGTEAWEDGLVVKYLPYQHKDLILDS